MKRIVLIAMLGIASVSAFAQTNNVAVKADSAKVVKQPAYQADPNRVYGIQLKLTANDFQLLSTPIEVIEHSDKLSGAQISQIKKFIERTWQGAADQLSLQMQADYRRYQVADSLANKKGVKLKK